MPLQRRRNAAANAVQRTLNRFGRDEPTPTGAVNVLWGLAGTAVAGLVRGWG